MSKEQFPRLANEHDTPAPPVEIPRVESWGGDAEFTLQSDILLSAAIISTLSKSFDGYDGIKPMFSMRGSTLNMSLVLDDNSQASYDKFREVIKQVMTLIPDIRLEYAEVNNPDVDHPILEHFARRREERELKRPLRVIQPID